ncbi:MAG: hypothetical protein AAB776_02325 [Patescibacteria group bacterium]
MELDDKKFAAFQVDIFKAITEVKTDLQAQIAEVKTDLQTQITEVKTDLRGEIAEVKSDFRQAIADEGRSSRDFTKQEIQASEHRLKAYVDEKTDVVLSALSHTIDNEIQPKFEDHEQRLTKLETKTA